MEIQFPQEPHKHARTAPREDLQDAALLVCCLQAMEGLRSCSADCHAKLSTVGLASDLHLSLCIEHPSGAESCPGAEAKTVNKRHRCYSHGADLLLGG